jgi:tetratricopeptide (TPR) repeat protein
MPRPTIELSMIVRDGGASLARCLRSVRPFVDRIVIGDTGSTDDSRSTAASFGAEVVSIPWREDFAAARNEVLALARCDWVLVLDADEMLDPNQAASLLPALLQNEDVHAYTLNRRDYVDRLYFERLTYTVQPNLGELPEARPYPAYTQSVHTRLFRRTPQVYFRDCVHEQITDCIDLLGLHRTSAPLTIHHFGAVETPAEVREAKIALYHRLVANKTATDPNNFEARLQLGIAELFQMNRPEDALLHLRRATALRPKDSRGPLYAGICLLRLGRLVEAQRSLLQAFALGEDSLALHDALGDTFLRSGEYSHALTAYQRAYASSNRSPLADAKIGAAEVQLGYAGRGLERIRVASERAPASSAIKQLLEVSKLASLEQAVA